MSELLDRLRAQLYEDMGGVDVSKNSANMTATEIKSAYAALNRKCDKIESYVDEFIAEMLEILGYEGEVWHYQRDVTINQSDAVQNIIASAPWLGEEMTTRALLEVQGKIDEFEKLQAQKIADGYNAFNSNENATTGENEGEGE
jgi:hypothetical protein